MDINYRLNSDILLIVIIRLFRFRRCLNGLLLDNLPRSVDVIMDDDLVDKVKPGDRVQLVGTYRSLGNRNASSSSSTFRTIILANNVVLLASKAGGGIAEEVITDSDLRNIRKLGKEKDVFNLLAKSLAPSIFGHDEIKKAILLLLLGGSEKESQR